MEYLTGYTIKPYEKTRLGEVIFTDGTNNDIRANQIQCEAYGYTYNVGSGTCSAFRFNQNLNRTANDINNKNNGSQNINGWGSNTIQINGNSNRTLGLNNNCLVNGSANEISASVKNSTVSGTLGESTADNSIVLGGNANGDALGERQMINLMYGHRTTTSGTVSSFLNNISGNFFAIPENTIMYFHADVIAVRVGGTATGTAGDYGSWVVRGAVINKSKTASIQFERDTIKTSGTTTLWRPAASVSGENFVLTVRGAANVTIEWAANITFTQIKTGVAL